MNKKELEWKFELKEVKVYNEVYKVPIPMVVWNNEKHFDTDNGSFVQPATIRLVLKRDGCWERAGVEYIFEKYKTIDSLGIQIWERIDVPEDFKDVIKEFVEQFDVPRVKKVEDIEIK